MQPDLRDEHDPAIPSALADRIFACRPAPASPGAQRAAIEAQGAEHPEELQSLDAALLRLRAVELADDGLPPVVGGVIRGALLEADAISATWLGWDEASGGRAAVRCLRTPWLRDPVLHRRIEAGLRLSATVPGLAPARFQPHDAWPHVRWQLPGTLLADLLPVEAPPELRPFARWMATALQTIAALHARGLRFGPLGPSRVLLTEHRAFLLWLDPFDLGPGDPATDVAALASSLLSLDPGGLHPLSQVALPWTGDTAPGAAEAAALVRRGLADELLAARHRLVLRNRTATRGERTARLFRAVLGLGRAVPPPAGRCCLHAGLDRTLLLVESDGRRVRGGRALGLTADLPVLYAPDRGLDAVATRAVLRAAARSEPGDEALRARIQASLPGDGAGGAALLRWLAAASRLRAAHLLLAWRLRRA
jgi:hypothetical protein